MTTPDDPEKPNFAQIAKELEKRHKNDQANIKDPTESGPIHRENAEWLKKLVAEVGWPTFDKVGTDASDFAWFLVQHSDHDLEFQESCLEIMKKLPEGAIHPQNIAYLEDRVLVAKKQPQLYGTQMRTDDNGVYRLYDMVGGYQQVNERRVKMGLGGMTAEEYEAKMIEQYRPKKEDQK